MIGAGGFGEVYLSRRLGRSAAVPEPTPVEPPPPEPAPAPVEPTPETYKNHIDGFSIRVYDSKGEITPAFRAYHELAERLADYPILDEEDYSRREYEETLRNIVDVMRPTRHVADRALVPQVL